MDPHGCFSRAAGASPNRKTREKLTHGGEGGGGGPWDSPGGGIRTRGGGRVVEGGRSCMTNGSKGYGSESRSWIGSTSPRARGAAIPIPATSAVSDSRYARWSMW